MVLMRLIDAYDRGYITHDEYVAYLNNGYTNNSQINVDITAYVEKFYDMSFRLIKRDPNLRIQLTFEIEGTGALGVLQADDFNSVYVPFDCRVCGYTVFLDTSATATFDVFIDTTFPPTSGDSITGASAPGITTGLYEIAGEAGVADWDQHVPSGSYLGFEVETNDNAHRATCTIVVEPATQLVALI